MSSGRRTRCEIRLNANLRLDASSPKGHGVLGRGGTTDMSICLIALRIGLVTATLPADSACRTAPEAYAIVGGAAIDLLPDELKTDVRSPSGGVVRCRCRPSQERHHSAQEYGRPLHRAGRAARRSIRGSIRTTVASKQGEMETAVQGEGESIVAVNYRGS